MNRKDFFKNTGILALTGSLFPTTTFASENLDINFKSYKKAKNIIFLVSDGMSIGTLNITDLFLQRKFGSTTNWLNLYRENRVHRALMETSSANSIVTDSSAGSSAWGGGFKVPNGSLNIAENGENYLPILQKFKQKGKKVGCVTTVPITHATPAGFCVNSKSRNVQDEIAEQYLNLKFNVMMGGGLNYFSQTTRKDKKNLITDFENNGFEVFKTKKDIQMNDLNKPVLGVFYGDALPYSIDIQQDKNLQDTIPTLAEMTNFAINKMKNNKNGFVLQVESGKVDWAAHGNDISALIHEQIAFDQAVKIAIDFAEKDKETLVIITTDHGNANPGIIYGKNAEINFDSIQKYKQSNDWILNGINTDFSVEQVKERVKYACNYNIDDDQAKDLLSHYTKQDEQGIYNPRKLPFRRLAEIQSKNNSIGWISMDHSADFVELAMFGPGSENLQAFVKNTDLHYFMLNACEIENKF